MFLKILKITGLQGEIRHIEFKKGVNLIVDNSEGENESGNNVGKTTILRLVDYCLGGKGDNIYTDPEFKSESPIKDFLFEEEVLITLVLAKNLDSNAAPKVTIEKNFLKRSQKIQRIDGESYSDKEFALKLADLLFGQKEVKPTLRQLIAKNIRDEKDKLNNILKVLNRFTSNIEYESLYQFWLGVYHPDGDDYFKAQYLHTKQKAYRQQLAGQFNTTDFQLIPTLKERMVELNTRKKSLDLDANYQEQLDTFDEIKMKISQVSSKLSSISLRKSLIEENRSNLESNLSKVVVEEIQAMYSEAKILIPTIQKSFEESVHFHNQMIQNKVEFITKELPSLIEEERALKVELMEQEEQAEKFKNLFHKDKTLVALEKLNAELLIIIERHAKLNEQSRIWESCLEELDSLRQQLEGFSEHAKDLNEQIATKLDIFNKSLKRISTELYGQEYVLLRSVKDNNGKDLKTLQFEMSGVTSNPGTGEKKSQITAFDLAYIEFSEKLGIPHLNFIIHDQIENVDGRQIMAILEILVPSINCQYIAPILKDKIPEGIDIDKYKIIELSQQEKLFKF